MKNIINPKNPDKESATLFFAFLYLIGIIVNRKIIKKEIEYMKAGNKS